MKELVKSKKVLVEYSFEEGIKNGLMEGVKKDYIVPVFENGQPTFVTLPNLRKVTYGFTVFIGREISVADLFKKLIDTEKKIVPSMDWQEKALNDFLSKVKNQKVGDVVNLSFDMMGLSILKKQKVPHKPK